MNSENLTREARRFLRDLHAPEVRRQIRADPRQYAVDNGFLPKNAADVEVTVVVDRPGVTHVALPSPGKDALDADDLASIQAAGGVSTAGTAGSVSTLGCACGTISTASTGGTVGSSGSVEVSNPGQRGG